jgi:hypothetical protein
MQTNASAPLLADRLCANQITTALRVRAQWRRQTLRQQRIAPIVPRSEPSGTL